MFSKYDVVLTRDLKNGMIIAQPIISEKGQILLEEGSLVTDETINKLLHWEIAVVSVACSAKSHTVSPGFLTTYKETLDLVSSTFKKVRKFKEVPISECKELAENYIALMIDIEGVLDSLYRIKMHHEYTFKHSLHVAILTGLLGKWTGFTGTRLKDLILSGLLHDIGKIFIPEKILDKPGPLTAEEMDIVRQHPLQGYYLLNDCAEISQEVKLGVLQHHEREDGSGYPLGLKGKDVNLCAKFVAVADIYDAMTTERVYRKEIPPLTAIHIMRNQMSDKLDPVTCLTLSAKLQEVLPGMRVLLSNGTQGKVVQMPAIDTARPVVQLDNGTLLDLENHESLTIVTLLE